MKFNMKQLSSRQNPIVKNTIALHDVKGRREANRFIGEGLRVCSTLVQSGVRLVQLFITPEHQEEVLPFAAEDIIYVVNSQVMHAISTSTTPSGILGVFEIPDSKPLERVTAGLILARIADPGNMGTMIRTCAAFGIKSVIMVEGADPYSPKVVQASAGTIGMVALFRASWQEIIASKKALLLAALVIKDGVAPTEIDSNNTLLVVGSEAHGIPQEWIEQCDQKITVPMPGGAESLNAAVVASIALYRGWIKG